MVSLKMEFHFTASMQSCATINFDSGPGLLAENLVNWSSVPETMQKYLFRWRFRSLAFRRRTCDRIPVALHKSTLKQAHRFSTMEELVNDMMQQALGDFGVEDPEEEPGSHSTGFSFFPQLA